MVKLFDLMPEDTSIFTNLSREQQMEKVLGLFNSSKIKLEDGRADLTKRRAWDFLILMPGTATSPAHHFLFP